jgi:pimeloyl-ACP methyl ester carboxylesterase
MMKLVLLPGLDGTGDLFAPFIDSLGDFPTQVIAYPGDRAMNYAEHEAHARARLPHDEPYVLLAESFSGPIGIAISVSRPPGLAGLILCATFASNPLPVFGPFARLIGALPAARIPPSLMSPWLFGSRATPELRRAHAQTMARVSPRVIRARVAALLAVDHRPLLRQIQMPMLYLRASRDRLIPSSAGRTIMDMRPDVELAEIDAPHFLLQTAPGQAAAAVVPFVRRVASTK